MSKQEKFYGLSIEPLPFNRRVYKAAKKPFAYLWEFLWEISLPWRLALPWALAASFALNALDSDASLLQQDKWGTFVWESIEVGLVFTFFLGIIFVVIFILRAIFE